MKAAHDESLSISLIPLQRPAGSSPPGASFFTAAPTAMPMPGPKEDLPLRNIKDHKSGQAGKKRPIDGPLLVRSSP